MTTLLEKKEAIREVIDRFSALEIDVAEQAELFTPDAHVELYGADGSLMMEFDGREKLIEVFGGGMSGVKTAYHMNGQQVITIDGDTATDIHYCQASLIREEDGRDVLTRHSIRYTDTLVNRGGRCLISRREQHFVLSETQAL